MERRWSLRKPVVLDAVLHHQPLGSVRCRTANISLGGVYLDTGRILLPIDAAVALDFIVPAAGNDRRLHHILAKVIRVTDEGVGLMFREFSARISRFLQDAYHTI